MFEVNAADGQHAIYSIANWLAGLPGAQVSPMPSPSAVNKNAARKASDKQNVEFGSKLAKKRSQDFVSKIQGWNEGGAGIARHQDDVPVVAECAVDSEKVDNHAAAETDAGWKSDPGDPLDLEVQHESIPTTPTTPAGGTKAARQTTPKKPTKELEINLKTAKEIDLGRQAWVRRRSKPLAEVSAEIKTAVAPRKRVVSDGNWRRDKSQTKSETATPEKEKEKHPSPKPVTVRRSVVSVGFKVPPSMHDFVQTEPETEVEPVRVRPIRRSRSKTGGPEAIPDYQDSGVKVYIKRRRRSNIDGERGAQTSESSLTAGSSFGKPSTIDTEITTPSVSPVKETSQQPATEPKQRPVRLSLEALEGQRHVSQHNLKKAADMSPSKSQIPRSPSGRKLLAKDRSPLPEKPAHRPTSPCTPKLYSNRIEGWLAGMSDPFTEEKESSTSTIPLTIPRRRSRVEAEAETASEDDEYKHRRKLSARRRHARPSVEQSNDAVLSPRVPVHRSSPQSPELSSSATPTLKRSGARRNTHSPVKDRLAREASPITDKTFVSQKSSDAHLRRQVSSSREFTRSLPSTGKQLSTIASIENLESRARFRSSDAPAQISRHPSITGQGSTFSHASDGDDPARHASGLKRRLTKHSDLISVLSLSRDEDHGLRPSRSVRARHPCTGGADIGELMNEVTTDELRYHREIRTLVEGVIPVLLTHVLQKPETRGSKRLSNGPSANDLAITAPIVEMGVALERLKSLHKRIPLHSPDELQIWALTAARGYEEYLRVWRLGFQDLVVNLAPAEHTPKTNDSLGWDHDLQRDKNGDLLSRDGDRVDVAYLLRRPLLRLKSMLKTLKAIDEVLAKPTSKDAVKKFEGLVQLARERMKEERARLEDQAAAGIDATRARDLQGLAPLGGVVIDPTRCVRARDYFDVELVHTSGQQLVCKVEVILRDDAPGRGKSSDILFCEVSASDRWLLFPPVLASTVSARRGDKATEMLVMLRGSLYGGHEWREMLTLTAEDEGAIVEWLEMLPSTPVPPKLSKKSSFITNGTSSNGPFMSGALPLTMDSLREVEIPNGEQAPSTSMKWDASEVNSVAGDESAPGLHRSKAKRYNSMPSSPITDRSHHSPQHIGINDALPVDDRIRSVTASRYHRRPNSAQTGHNRDCSMGSRISTPRNVYSVWLPSSQRSHDAFDAETNGQSPPVRPDLHRRTSSVPSTALPTIPKLRKPDPPATPGRDFAPLNLSLSRDISQESPAPAKLHKLGPSPATSRPTKDVEAPKPPKHHRPTSVGLRAGALPSFTPAFLKRHRRSSSPLKHEYEPSTASDSPSESDLSDSYDTDSITSESAAGEVEAVSTVGELKDFTNFGSLKPTTKSTSQRSDFSLSGTSLRPSDSASQAPFRHVPPSTAEPSRTVACIFSWSDRGVWDSLHPQECVIVVTPGLIEAFDLAQAHTVTRDTTESESLSPSAHGVKPLVALELTPLVPLRRGTALDISIRSPPTVHSLIRTGTNIMFRSRSAEECEKLYHLINRARIDNPTYIALQNARGPPRSNWAEIMDERNAARSKGSSWLSLGSKKTSTYRSSGSRPASIVATESSVATMNSAFSALRRFSGASRFFNIAKSTLTSKEGSRSTFSEPTSSGAVTPISVDPGMGTPLGIANTKIRLYLRESASKWTDLGSARLTVMLPARQDPLAAANPNTKGVEKRIIIRGRNKDDTLLDVTLGESAFERVARTGIALSVWAESTGPNGELGQVGARGGVVSSNTKVFMIQMKSERDAAYTFGLVGKLRY